MAPYLLRGLHRAGRAAGLSRIQFAPSGEWCVYALSGYRNGSPLADEAMRPDIRVRSTQSRLELDALVRLDSLSAVHPNAVLRIGLSAVIESTTGTHTGRFAISPTSRISMMPMDSPCCLSPRPLGIDSESTKLPLYDSSPSLKGRG